MCALLEVFGSYAEQFTETINDNPGSFYLFLHCVCVCVCDAHHIHNIGVRMSEPHTIETALRMCVCIYACLLVLMAMCVHCTLNFKCGHKLNLRVAILHFKLAHYYFTKFELVHVLMS